MYYKNFHGKQISKLGLGCMRFPLVQGSEREIDRPRAEKLLDTAIANGVNYFDTAFIYQDQDSERFLGEALSRYPRESYFLTTKYYEGVGLTIEEMFEKQLQNCRTEYFDFYLLHSVNRSHMPGLMKEENYKFLLRQKEAGRIRNIGFSSHAAPDELERFLDWHDSFDMAMIQLNYLDWTLLHAQRQYEILTERGLPVWVMEPLKGGRLASLNREAEDILRAAAPERSIASWSFRFLQGLENVQTILSGMTSETIMQDNFSTFAREDRLSAAEQDALRHAREVFLKDMGVPCSACRYCCKTCPAGLDIPLLIRGYNEMRISGEEWRLPELKQTKGPENCLHCGICTKHCPQEIKIPDVMRALEALRQKKH